jgi:Alginate lyase
MRKQLISRLLCIAFLASTTLFYRCEKPALDSLNPTAAAATGAASPKVAAAASPQITTFVHPGILNTTASLNFIASQVNSGNASRSADYQVVENFVSNHAVSSTFPSVVVVGSNGATSPSKNQIRTDCEMAYALALRWAKSGIQTYANEAIQILNGWSYNFQSYSLLNSSTNPNQPDLEASWTTPTFVAAAEILRYYTPPSTGVPSGWASADINQFNTYLNTVKNTYINNTPDFSNNWDISAAYAKMAIGIFLNSTTVYQNGYNSIMQYLPIVIESNGTVPELCVREDCVHFQYTLTGLSFAAELARIQGDNSIWTANSNLISAGYDYMRAAYNGTTGCNYCSTSSPVYPGVEQAYNFYQTSNLSYLRGLDAPLGVPADNTFAGFTTYTCFGVPGL